MCRQCTKIQDEFHYPSPAVADLAGALPLLIKNQEEKMQYHLLKSGIRLTATAALIGLLGGCVSKSAYDAAQNEYEAVLKEKNALASNNTRLQNRISELEAQNSEIAQRLNLTSDKLGKKAMVVQEQEDKLQKASSQLDQTAEALRSREEELQRTASTLEEKETRLKELEEQQRKNQKVYDNLVSKLNKEMNDNQVKIQQMKDGINLNLSQEILFDSGSAELNKSGVTVLRKVSQELKDIAYQTVVSGHTDNVPISGGLAKVYPTNWDLAGARASRVVHLLEESGVSSDKLMAVSFGETQPIAPNDNADGRKQNRRIEIRLRPLQ